MPAPHRPEIISLGCRLNIAESEGIRALLGQVDREVAVVNSCAVTDAAVKHSRAAVRRLRRLRPDAELVVTGCAAQVDPEGFAAMAEVDRVVDNAAKLLPASWAVRDAVVRGEFGAVPEPPTPSFDEHARAFVEVQNGCDHRCTFCAIPHGRGPSRSVQSAAVVERVRRLVDAGHREVVLTGVDLTSHDETLGRLVERVLDGVPALERLRLSSLDPVEVDERLFACVTGEPRVMPHLHLSFQAGHDLVLKRMRRRHSRAQAVALVARLKAARPEIAVGADLIAGFPTETEAMFADTLALLDDCDVVHAHIFPYSAKAGTPAARMPQVPMPVRRERAARLREAAARARARWLGGLVGTEQAVLVERCGARGVAPNFAAVRLPPSPPGRVVRARITAAGPDHLEGIPT